MKSLLDNGQSWVLNRIEYAGGLDIFLQELKRGPKADANIDGSTIENVYPLLADEGSLVTRVTFSDILAWQCLNESATTDFPGEVYKSSGFLSVLSSSAYLNYVLSSHGWYVEVQERPVQHYRVWSENEILDVVAFSPPVIEPVNA
ncbi:hypothetical protein ACJJID_11570 [Microbulbifer sp. CnH-101-G]|uniref:hypothetical protein n=1 Tax=Microbulbifer sp. CnH-101-G TaxID=3243393 RepID=UPI00403957AE